MTETKKSKKTKKTPSPSKIKKLESKLIEQEEEINQWKTTAQRSQADLINLKRRTLEEMQVNKRKTKINLFTKYQMASVKGDKNLESIDIKHNNIVYNIMQS